MSRVVCFIPSITETLIDCGVEVVGRTRFCIHPTDQVNSIAIVGGTKDVKWDKVIALSADLVILDKEENTLKMANGCPLPYFVLHITGVDNIAGELGKLAEKLNNSALTQVAHRWRKISNTNKTTVRTIEKLPGMIRSLHSSSARESNANKVIAFPFKRIDYMIWKDPWMAIGPETFIWSVLAKVGFESYLIPRDEKYPNLGECLDPDPKCFYFFSSEPYPFEKYVDQLADKGFNGAIVDGECFSWYGTRSLSFLESELSRN